MLPHFHPSSLLLCSKKQKENQEDLLKRVNDETMRQLRHAQVQSLWCCVWCWLQAECLPLIGHAW